MLTVAKLMVWKSLHGDGDAFERGYAEHSSKVISYEEWAEIELFISDMRLISRDLAAQSFVDDFERRMATVEDEAARDLLRKLATKRWP